MKKIIFFCLILLFVFSPKIRAEDNIVKKQTKDLGISDFLNEANKYSTEVLEGKDINDLYENAISGNIKNDSIGKKILNLLFKEILEAISSMSLILIIILIHSLLKSFSNGFGNSSVSEIAYYISYILIVTIIMKNFASIINLIKSSIENLVTFINCLIPILLALLTTSGGITSSAILQPFILFFIILISNIITKIIIPFSLAALSISIVSNITDKIQLAKLSKFISSTSIWALGILLTIFVGITSVEGSLGKRS